MSRPDWFPDWSGQRCVIVASGPSAMLEDIAAVGGRARAIVVNNSWRLAPWADALYASDAEWWQSGRGDAFEGLKVSRSMHPDVHLVGLRRGKDGNWTNSLVLDEPGVIGAGAGSGFQALNLAIQWGAKDIALVGFDHRVDLGTHWHGDHVGGLKNPFDNTAALWRLFLDDAAADIAAKNVSVANCSAVSALTAYPKIPLVQWLGQG